jgi:hypothetical protein
MARVVAFVCLLLVASGAAADPPAILKKMPPKAGVVVVIEHPRAVLDGAIRFDAYRGLQQFPQVKEFFDSTGVRRFFQLVKYLETQLGGPWPDVLDKLAGNGIAVGIGLGKDPAPAVLIIEGTDENTSSKAYEFFVAAAKSEGDRPGTKQAVTFRTHLGVAVMQIGTDAHFARVGRTIYAANNDTAMDHMLQIATGQSKECIADKPTVSAARKLVGEKPAAWAWLDMAAVKATEEGKNFFESTKKDLLQSLVLGSSIDALSRSDFVAFVLDQSPAGFTFAVRLPAGRSGLDKDMAFHVPAAGVPGSRPLLLPKGVLYSQSFHLDLGYYWKNRKSIINAENLKDIEKGESDINKLLPNTSLGKLFEQSGPYHRIVAAHTGEKLYAIEPAEPIPPTALVLGMRDAAFGESLDGVLRGVALLIGFQTRWKKTESEHDGTTIVTYRFPETGDFPVEDAGNLRFNAAPSFAIVGNSVVIGSTPGIVKLLIPELKAESKTAGEPEVWRATVTGAGVADFLQASPDATITRTILQQGIGLAEAKAQMTAFTDWLRTTGRLNITIHHAETMYEFRWDWKYSR